MRKFKDVIQHGNQIIFTYEFDDGIMNFVFDLNTFNQKTLDYALNCYTKNASKNQELKSKFNNNISKDVKTYA